MALYMLGTDSAVCLIRGTSRALDRRIDSTSREELCISAVTRGELLCGLSLQALQTMARGSTPEEASRGQTMEKKGLDPSTAGRRRRRPYVRPPRETKSRASPLDEATLESLRRTTHSALAKLTPGEAKALRERFGLDPSADHRLEKVSRQFDVTRERIRHTEQTQHLSRVVDQFLARVSCLPWDAGAATQFATVAIELHRVGTPMGTTDTMIAGHAIAVGAVLVTTDEQRFAGVRGLKAEDWTR